MVIVRGLVASIGESTLWRWLTEDARNVQNHAENKSSCLWDTTLGFAMVAISGYRTLCASRRNSQRTGLADFPHQMGSSPFSA
jgi:hypothetical protein